MSKLTLGLGGTALLFFIFSTTGGNALTRVYCPAPRYIMLEYTQEGYILKGKTAGHKAIQVQSDPQPENIPVHHLRSTTTFQNNPKQIEIRCTYDPYANSNQSVVLHGILGVQLGETCWGDDDCPAEYGIKECIKCSSIKELPAR